MYDLGNFEHEKNCWQLFPKVPSSMPFSPASSTPECRDGLILSSHDLALGLKKTHQNISVVYFYQQIPAAQSRALASQTFGLHICYAYPLQNIVKNTKKGKNVDYFDQQNQIFCTFSLYCLQIQSFILKDFSGVFNLLGKF